jgi:hypothetical protein
MNSIWTRTIGNDFRNGVLILFINAICFYLYCPWLFLGQNALISEEVSFGKRGGYEFDEADFLGLDFFEKKRSKGLPPGLAPAFEPLRDDDFPEVDIIVGDPSKFDKSPRRTEIQPVDNGESGEASQSTTKPNEADKAGIAPPSTVIETEEDEDVYRPTVRSWGMFPRPQNISKAVRYSCSISYFVFASVLPNTKKI